MPHIPDPKVVEPAKLIDWVKEQEAKDDSPWLMKDLMQADSAIQVTGPATRGFKTWFAMATAMVLASNKKVEALEPLGGPHPVLYLLQEGPAKPSADRFRKLEKGLGIQLDGLPIQFAHRQQFFLDDNKHVDEIRGFILDHGIKLTVIDTLAKVNRGDENSSRDVGACMRGIDVLRKSGCGIMYLHHVGKPPGEKSGPRDIDDETRGSSALAGGYDIHLAFRKRFDSQKHLDLTVRGNQLPEKYYEVQWYVEEDQARFSMRETEPGDVAESLKDELVLKLMPERGYLQADLERVWGIGRAQVKQVANKLLEEKVMEYRQKQYWIT